MNKREYFFRLSLVDQYDRHGLRWSQYRTRAAVWHTQFNARLRPGGLNALWERGKVLEYVSP